MEKADPSTDVGDSGRRLLPSKARGAAASRRTPKGGRAVGAWCECGGSTRGQHRVKGALLKLAATKANLRGGYFWDFKNFATSRAVGMEGWAPLRVTEIAATAEA
jgi:hypothetical protein